MPLKATTYLIDDFVPPLKSSPDWISSWQLDDPQISQYGLSSYIATNTTGASAQFSFTGTGFTIFGGKRPDHGSYQVTVDGKSSTPMSGQDSNGNGSFKAELFVQNDLQMAKHDVTITNLEEGKVLDIDHIRVNTIIGSTEIKYADTENNVGFYPKATWLPNTKPSDSNHAPSGQVTSTSHSVMNFTFQGIPDVRNLTPGLTQSLGSAVALFGTLDTNGGPFSIQLDGEDVFNATSLRDHFWPYSLLWNTFGLKEDRHEIRVTFNPAQPGQQFVFDHAKVYSDSSVSPSSSLEVVTATGSSPGVDATGPSTMVDQPLSNSSSRLPAGAVAGIAVGACVALALAVILVWLLMNRRRRRNTPAKELGSRDSWPHVTPFTAGSPATFVSLSSTEITQTPSKGPAVSNLEIGPTYEFSKEGRSDWRLVGQNQLHGELTHPLRKDANQTSRNRAENFESASPPAYAQSP